MNVKIENVLVHSNKCCEREKMITKEKERKRDELDNKDGLTNRWRRPTKY